MKPLILLPGRNGKTSLYARLRPRFPELVTPEWIEPLVDEPLANYAQRMAETLHPQLSEGCVLGGTSFGGMVAHEMAPALGLNSCLLISTVRGPSELPANLQALRAHTQAGEAGFEGVPLLKNRFARWTAWAILTWELSPAAQSVQTWHLHGDLDSTFPIGNVHPDEIVPGGGHVLPMTHPDAVEGFLRRAHRPLLCGKIPMSSQ